MTMFIDDSKKYGVFDDVDEIIELSIRISCVADREKALRELYKKQTSRKVKQ